MIVFDLICTDAAHLFEGWFGSSDEYEEQKSNGLLVCPVCSSQNIKKAVMAPNVGMKGNQTGGVAVSDVAEPPPQNSDLPPQTAEATTAQLPAEGKELLLTLAKAQSDLLEKSEWVGDSFSKEARAIHYGDSEEKPIHGTATPDEVDDLEEEGIELMPLPFPVAPRETQN